MKKLGLNEDFICRIWEDKSYYNGLKTCNDESVEILDYGKKNHDSGPDYKDAKVKIGDAIYRGSIEIHRSMKDWYLHNHKGDNKYNNLILHVVFYGNESDEINTNPKVKKSRIVPSVILSDYLTKSIHEIWKEIINNPSPAFKPPCFPENQIVSHSILIDWLNSLSMVRLKFKSERINQRLKEISPDIKKKHCWEQSLFEFICEALGYSKNKEQFLRLSNKIELSQIKKLNLSRTQIDSLLFGLSGFLNDLRFKNQYIENLKTDWKILKDIFRKEIMDKSEWNFFRLRPPNFPTLRIAYASGLLYEIVNGNLFRDIIKIYEESANVKTELEKCLANIKVSEYWSTHYNFGKETKSQINVIGRERITDIITNIILPTVYLYSRVFHKENLKKRAEFFYRNEKQKSGNNEVTRLMEKQLDIKVHSIADEQALIQLHNYYCVKGRCNECEIGKIIFPNDKVNEPLRIILY